MLWRLSNSWFIIVIDFVKKFCGNYIGFILSAIMVVLSFPPFDLYWFAFVFFIPAFISIENEKVFKRRVVKSALWGILIFLGLFYWTVITIHQFGRMNIILSFVLFIPLSVYQMLPFIILLATLNIQLKKSLFLPALTFPLLTNFFPLIFPYGISSSISSSLFLPQLADITGEWGLDFLIILINILIYNSLQKKDFKNLIYPLLILVFMFSYGLFKVHITQIDKTESIDVVVIQPVINDCDNDRVVLNKLFNLIKEAKNKSEGKTVILPESAIPDSLGTRNDFFKVMDEIRNQMKAERLIYNHTVFEKGKLYNASFLTGETESKYYYKNKLMLFGEKFPFHSLITKLPLYIANFASFDCGNKIHTLDDKGIKFSTPICLEAVYQNYTAKLSKGSNIIVNQTNDEWFGRTKATYLHFAQVRLKAIENRKYLIRSTNTGYTVIVDTFGRIVSSLRTDKQGILFEEVFLNNRITIFQNIYYLIPYLLFFLSTLIVIFSKKK